jgi:transcriptional regulator with XRE-family HTH domain
MALLRERRGWSQRDLNEAAGLKSSSHVAKIEAGDLGVSEKVLAKLAEALGVRPEWLATGEGPQDPGAAELDLRRYHGLIERFERIPVRLRTVVETLIRELSAPAASVAPSDELAERRQARPVRLVGVAAARETTASIAYSDRQSDDLEDVPPELVDEGCAVIRVAGSSMEGAGIPDGSELLVCPAALGAYYRGDIVVADTPRGEVVKRYAGQGGAARPKQPAGVIVLESVGEGETIVAPKAEEGVEGITVQSVVKAVRRPGGQWERLERSRR